MKSSQIVAQNQRVERISTSTLVIGIDIAKESHAAQATTFRGIVLTKRVIEFSNSLSGYEHLERSIRKLQEAHAMDDVIVGMESTGHYWFNIANWLIDRGMDVVLVNPATTKRNKENRDNSPSKSDPKDALVIADVVSRGYYTPYKPSDELFQRLRVLVKNREHWVVESGRLQNQITRWLDIRFPEYTSVFKEIFTPRSLATLRSFPTPTDLRGLTPPEIVEVWTSHMSRAGGARGNRKATELLHVASHSVGDVAGLEEDKWELQHLLDTYQQNRKTIDEADERIRSLLSKIPCAELLRSVGISVPACAAILAFGGDLRNLEHGNQLLRKAGLNLAERSSGKHQGKIKLSKRGNALLRKHLFFTVIHLLSHNPVFQALHERNVKIKRMSKMKSVMKLVGKLARMLVAMAREDKPFLPERVHLQAA